MAHTLVQRGYKEKRPIGSPRQSGESLIRPDAGDETRVKKQPKKKQGVGGGSWHGSCPAQRGPRLKVARHLCHVGLA